MTNILGLSKSRLITHQKSSFHFIRSIISDTCFRVFFTLGFLCRYFSSPVQWKHYSHPLSYLCSHTQTIPDHFISLCCNKSILHHLDIWSSCLFFQNRYSIINASVHKGWFWWWFSLNQVAMSISDLNYAFLFIIAETGILSYSEHSLQSSPSVCVLSLQQKH